MLLNGKPLADTFGTRGAAWGWQGGQEVRIAADTVELALDDLTGFEGRCDAIAFTASDAAPPNQPDELETFRQECLGRPAVAPSAGEFDLVVTGGGVAGICTAVTAGRNISVTHVALGQVRVQNTTGMMGEVVGRAASICVRHGVSPRAVHEEHLAELEELLRRPVK